MKDETQYFRPVDWAEYQTRSNNQRSWFKVSHKIRTNEKWLRLTLEERGFLVELWAIFSETSRPLPLNDSHMSRVCSPNIRTIKRILRVLLSNDLIELCDRTLGLWESLEKEEEKEEETPYSPPAGDVDHDMVPKYAFEGKVVRLNQRDFDGWSKRFHAIPDMVAVLQSQDDFYATQEPKSVRNWFIRLSRHLDNQHQKFLGKGNGSVPNGAGLSEYVHVEQPDATEDGERRRLRAKGWDEREIDRKVARMVDTGQIKASAG